MTNKMPEMPKNVAGYRHDISWTDGIGAPTFSSKPPKPINGPMAKCVVSEAVSNLYTEDQLIEQRRACYLAGIADAKACVPVSASDCGEVFFNACRDQTLANLTALEQEAKK